jgi:hypothetical protein
MNAPRTLRNLLVICAASAAVLATLGLASVAAASTATGTWSCCGSGGASPQTWTITESGGALSGSASFESGQAFSPITGKVSGASVEIVTGPYFGSSYSATFLGTISGETMSGTWTSNASQSGTWMATRGSVGEEAAKKAEEAKKKEEEEKANALRRSATQINCDSFDPGLPNEYFQCTAQVGDASGRSPAAIPSGTVAFAVSAGARGGFAGSSTCTLAPSSTGGASSFCSVDYVPPVSGVPVGSQPPITATYSGSSVFKGGSATPQGPVSNGNPLTAQGVFETLCVASFIEACNGVVPTPSILSAVCFSLAPSGALVADSACPSSADASEILPLTPNEAVLDASATCPAATSGDLTSCELQSYVAGGPLEPEIQARFEYAENYANYLKEVNSTRNAALAEQTDFLEGTPLPANEPERKEAEESRKHFIEKLNKHTNELYDGTEGRGSEIRQPYALYTDDEVKSVCSPSPAASECERLVKKVVEVNAEEVSSLAKKKADFGVNVPFKAPPSGKASAVAAKNSSRRRKSTEMVYASGTASIHAGKTGTLHLVIPPFVRHRLKRALARGRHTLKLDLVVHIKTATNANGTRTIPLKVKLLAKKPRRAGKKK